MIMATGVYNDTNITVRAFGGLPNYLALQLQFPCLSSRMQLQEKIPIRNSQEFSADYSYMIELFSTLKCHDFEKNGSAFWGV